MKRLIGILWVFVVSLLLAFVLSMSISQGKELPVMVPLDQISEVHDGTRIVVSGVVTERYLFRGRTADSVHFMTYLGDLVLVTAFEARFKVGKRVVAQGRYQHEGRVGGRPFERFMFVEEGAIMYDPIGEEG